MSLSSHRRRGLVLLALALACGGLAASQVQGRVAEVEQRVGPLVPVAVAARDLALDEPLRRRSVAMRRVPASYVPPDALGSARAAVGARIAVPLARGAYLTAAHLQGGGAGPAGRGGSLRPGERAVEVGVAGGEALAGAGAGARVDVLVSSESGTGGGQSFLAFEDVELLALRPAAADPVADPAEGPGVRAGAIATLRVNVRQAVYLAAAANFAREVRLLARPPGDRRRVGAIQVGSGDL